MLKVKSKFLDKEQKGICYKIYKKIIRHKNSISNDSYKFLLIDKIDFLCH